MAVSSTSSNPLGINLNNVTTDANGHVTVGGISSGIDWTTVVDDIMKAKTIPVDQIKTTIDANTKQITAYNSLNTVLGAFRDSLNVLRGAVSFDNSTDAFSAKQVFTSVTRTDGQTPSAATNLVGVTATNAAATTTHSIEVLRTAKAEKDSSDAVTSTTTALGLNEGDKFTINGQTITVSANDTLLALRDRINSANSGANPTGVTASIVSVSPTQNFLVLTADKTGAPITFANTTGTPLDTLGVTSGGTTKHQLVTAATAQLYADGILDQTNKTYESARQSSGSTTLGSNGTIRFNNGTTTVDLAYTAGQSIQSFADSINANTSLQGMGISASVVTEGNQVRLKIQTTGAAFTTSEVGGGSALTDLGMKNSRLLITRDSNTVSDLFSGVSLNLIQAEIGTTVDIDVTPDLSSMKTAITSFVTAYNALKTFINQQTQLDATGKPLDASVLAKSQTLRSISDQINGIFGNDVSTSSATIKTLADIGITFVDGNTLSDPTQANTMTVDQTKLNNALNANSDDVRKLFAFNFTSSDPRVTMLAYSSQTTPTGGGYTLNVGPIADIQKQSAGFTSSSALLNDGANVAATISGQFTLSGTTVSYDVTTDTLDSLASKINGLAIANISAQVITNASGQKQLQLSSTSAQSPVTLSGDTGNLLTHLAMTTTGQAITSANINGAADGSDDGSMTVNGMALTATTKTGANGLQIHYNGTSAASGINLDFTLGLGSSLWGISDRALDTVDGSVQNEINALNTNNTNSNNRITQMQANLDAQRAALLARFQAMETAMSQMNSIMSTLTQAFNSLNNNNNN
ncbi:MAG TPA: flagellar filament capping protein FliD [Alphaproteobacteria bacterium]|nr:flagellar filament capping protein FliD [Alphaproteobacteria bacterium]